MTHDAMEKSMLEAMDAWEALTDTSRTGWKAGDCYRNAARFVLEKGDADGKFDGSPLLLCHGQVRAPNGDYHGHAWVEWGDGNPLVFDPSNDHPNATVILGLTYYELGHIWVSQVKKYTREEVRAQIVKAELYGPWEGDHD